MVSFDVSETWYCYIQGGRCACHRSRLLEYYFPIAKRIAGSFRKRTGSPVDYDELVSWSVLGLAHAIETWDPTRKVRFESWAALQMRGRILDEVRVQDWAPRTVRRRQRELDRTYERLLCSLGREPTVAEIAVAIATTEEDVRLRQHETTFARIHSLDETFDPAEAREIEDPSHGHLDVEERDLLIGVVREAARKVDMTSRLVLVLYYVEGLSLEQVSRVVGLPEHRISQMHAKAVAIFREAVREALLESAVA